MFQYLKDHTAKKKISYNEAISSIVKVKLSKLEFTDHIKFLYIEGNSGKIEFALEVILNPSVLYVFFLKKIDFRSNSNY